MGSGSERLISAVFLRFAWYPWDVPSRFDRLEELHKEFLKRINGFLPWYYLLKRCYPTTDGTLAWMMATGKGRFARWKSGKRNPGNPSLQCLTLLIAARIGMTKPRDLIMLGTTSLEELTARVDRCLAREDKLRLRRAARKAAKENSAKSGQSPSVP